MAIPGDLRARMEATVEALHGIRAAKSDGKALAEAMVGSVAWNVGVISPGFIGLLFQAQTMASRTHLPPGMFALVVVATELTFLAGILASVILHGLLTGVVQQRLRTISEIGSLVVDIRTALALDRLPECPPLDLAGAVGRLTLSTVENEQHQRAIDRAALPAAVYGLSVIVGYGLLSVLVVFQYFKF